jgi:ribosomal protein L37AE/L43A
MRVQAGSLQNTWQRRETTKGNRVLVRTFLAILKTTTTALVFSFVFLFDGEMPPLFLLFALIATTGLIAGMTSRRMLKDHSRLLQYLVGVACLFAALFALSYYSSGVIGIDYLAIYQADFDPPAIIQLTISLFTTWLALAAWRKPKNNQFKGQTLPNSPSYRSSEVEIEPQQPVTTSRVNLPRTRRLINWFSGNPQNSSRNSGSQLASISPPQERISVKKNHQKSRRVSKIRTRRSTLLLNRQKPVKFVGAEEHRCPYCLEPVVYNDPRGVEICSVCQTHHHADCWEVTGVCQVPHSNG